MEHKEGFRFTYSAARQQEVEHIRKKYLPQAEEENKMEQLRKLHHSASEKAQARAIAVGTMGALMMGIGMSLLAVGCGFGPFCWCCWGCACWHWLPFAPGALCSTISAGPEAGAEEDRAPSTP